MHGLHLGFPPSVFIDKVILWNYWIIVQYEHLIVSYSLNL